MSNIQIPVPKDAASREQIVLDQVPYNILLTWNERAGAWVLGLEDRDAIPLIVGRRVVLNLDLLGGYHHLNIPTGAIFAVDPTGKLLKVGMDDLTSGRVLLIYTPKADLNVL